LLLFSVQFQKIVMVQADKAGAAFVDVIGATAKIEIENVYGDDFSDSSIRLRLFHPLDGCF